MTPVQRSIFHSAIERYGNLLLFFVSIAILARLLDPWEFGVYAVVGALVSIIGLAFQEFGGANYLIQKRELSIGNIRTAFTVTFGLSAAAGALLLLLAGPAARFFEQPGLQAGIAVSTLNFLLTPFVVTITALRRRALDYGMLAWCNLIASVVGAVTSVALALLQFSYMAPIYGGIAGSAVLTAILLVRHHDLTAFRPSLAGCRDIFRGERFGLHSAGVIIINIFYNFAPQLFLARVLDFSSVGLYARAETMAQVFDRLALQALGPVTIPAIARKPARADLRRVYLDAVRVLSAVQWPALLFVAIMAPTIVLLWLGPNWLEIVPLVRLLCLARMALFAACLSSPVFVAIGRMSDILVTSLIALPPSLLVMAGAAFFSVEAVAASALLTLPFQALVAISMVKRPLQIGWQELAEHLTSSLFVTAWAAAGVLACSALIEAGVLDAVPGLLAACLLGGLCWWLGLSLTGHPLMPQLHQALGCLTLLLGRCRPGGSRL